MEEKHIVHDRHQRRSNRRDTRNHGCCLLELLPRTSPHCAVRSRSINSRACRGRGFFSFKWPPSVGQVVELLRAVEAGSHPGERTQVMTTTAN